MGDEKKIAPEDVRTPDDQDSGQELSKEELDEVAGGTGGGGGTGPVPHH